MPKITQESESLCVEFQGDAAPGVKGHAAKALSPQHDCIRKLVTVSHEL
jgi:hypothetical protein